MKGHARTALAIALTVSGLAIVGSLRPEAGQETERQGAVETSRIRSWARADGGAGPSVLPKRVPPADEDDLHDLKELPGFHEFAMRCSSCHDLPDPATYPAERWIGKVHEMGEHIRRAGVMPPPESELEAVRRFLGAASGSLRQR